jgi:hypothetical protein
MMNNLLLGAIAMACFTASLFFLRFWRTTHDRFFLFFAFSFFIEGCSRVMLGLIHYSDEQEPLFYVIRLIAFLVIIFAILDKNWSKKL